MADNTLQEKVNRDATLMLRHHFRGREDVLVANNLLVYYVKDKPKKRVVPDVMVALGVRGGDRMSYFVWEEGKAPDFVLEVSDSQFGHFGISRVSEKGVEGSLALDFCLRNL